jgi:hypothetical protein
MRSAKTLTATIGTVALAATTFLVLLPCPSNADDESAMIGEIAVEAITAMPAKAGEITRITFSIENSGSDRVTVTGVRWPTGEPSRIVGSLGTNHSVALQDFPVDTGDAIRFDGKTAWIEVGPLKEELMAGSIVSARLLLGAYDAPVSVHVSPHPKLEPLRGAAADASPICGSAFPNWLAHSQRIAVSSI